jgi:hypothetical protein
MPDPIHPLHPPGVLKVHLTKTGDRGHAEEEHDRQQDERERDESATEVGRLATSASATTAPESAATKIDARLIASVVPRLRADSRLQCSVVRICNTCGPEPTPNAPVLVGAIGVAGPSDTPNRV